MISTARWQSSTSTMACITASIPRGPESGLSSANRRPSTSCATHWPGSTTSTVQRWNPTFARSFATSRTRGWSRSRDDTSRRYVPHGGPSPDCFMVAAVAQLRQAGNHTSERRTVVAIPRVSRMECESCEPCCAVRDMPDAGSCPAPSLGPTRTLLDRSSGSVQT